MERSHWDGGDPTDRTERTDPGRVWEVEKARVGIPGIGGRKNGEIWKVAQINRLQKLERVKGIEPSPQAWEARVLPLNYTRFATCSEASEGRIRFKVQVQVPGDEFGVFLGWGRGGGSD